MIIKSMARKTPSFSQLVQYFHKDQYHRKAPTFSRNMWETENTDNIAAEFEENATFLPKRANGNYLYHECIVLGHHPEVSTAKQMRILLDLVQQYVSLRAPDQMVYGRMHLDTNYYHFHLCISANTVRGKQRRWLSKSAFDSDLPLLCGPPFKLEFGGYGRPVGLTVTECRTVQQGEARLFLGRVVDNQANCEALWCCNGAASV